MITQVVKYKDYNGNEKSKELYFDLDKFELMQLERAYPGGYSNTIKDLNAKDDKLELANLYMDLVIRAYGEKSSDGEYFNKSEAITTAFIHSAAFNALFNELISDSSLVEKFIKGIIPADITQ